ncbi:MAG: endo-1,4-beta-xylanase [Prevotella sp.]|nr:endo-1,4-beta-xylanase [Prevotella sp.]
MRSKRLLFSVMTALLLASCSNSDATSAGDDWSLKGAFGDRFLVGAAINQLQSSGQDTAAVEVIRRHFNSIVAENCMKCEAIHPEENRYDFVAADSLMDFGEASGMAVIGHCLIWHSQCAPWFFTDSDGNQVSAEVLKLRMKDHITTIVSRYKGRVHGWDVVNEAILEDGTYRQSKFYEILGEEYIPLAFSYAHEADPDAELYYNDYAMNMPAKREAVVKLVRSLKEQGLRIDAVGMQGHMGMDYPDIGEFEESIKAFAAEGVNVNITEWDMSALPTVSRSANVADKVEYEQAMNPYPDGLPDSISRQWNARMKAFFELFLRHSDVITRVTAWGVSDGDSWKNDYPMKGRKEYPLLFDRNYQPKPFVRELCNPKKAVFDSFVYSASEEAVGDGAAADIANPILPGCYPDPSICRAGDDYYLVNSSFVFYPGIPIWHSKDLKTWTQLGYVLNRPSQANFPDGLRISGGIYAPDLKYNPNDKLFYLIVTDVNGGGTFFVTTDDPKKRSWSDPTCLPDVGGIDPSFLFDDDGKAYIVNNDAPEGTPLYDGHRAIWIREFDWKNGTTTGKAQMIINGGVDISTHPVWIEGPHLYHIGGAYYLMAAEGGTGTDHSEVVFRAETPFGPFTPCDINPILTQRDLPAGRPNPVTCTGHADLVETADGDWYAVFLAVRPYRDDHDVMGRETFLLPVKWTDNQPVILPQGDVLTYSAHPVPATPLWTKEGLANEAIFIRTPQTDYYDIDNKGRLSLACRSVRLSDEGQPSVIGRWATSGNICAQTSLAFTPATTDDFAGITVFHDDSHYIAFGKTIDDGGQPCVKLAAYNGGEYQSIDVVPLSGDDAGKELWLKVESDGKVNYSFSWTFNPKGEWTQLGEPISADILSTHTAGGFTGTLVGIYAGAAY